MKRIKLLFLNAKKRVVKLFSKKAAKNDSGEWCKLCLKVDEFMYKNRTWLIAAAFVSGLVLSFGALSESYGNARRSYVDTINALTDSINVINIDKETIVSQKSALELSIKDLRSLSAEKDSEIFRLKESIEKLKKAKTDPVIVVDTEIDSSSQIDNQGSVDCLSDTIVSFKDDILDAKLSVVADTTGVKLESLNYHVSIPLSVSVGKDRKVSVMTNKNVTVSNLTSWVDPELFVKPKRKWFSVGVQAGYGMTLNGASPYVGIGLNVNLIDF